MLLGGILVDGGAWGGQSLGVKLLGLPDEVLEQVAVVLGKKQILCLFNNFLEVGYQCLSLGRESLRRACECLRLEKAVQRDIDLVILGGQKVSIDILLPKL